MFPSFANKALYFAWTDVTLFADNLKALIMINGLDIMAAAF